MIDPIARWLLLRIFLLAACCQYSVSTSEPRSVSSIAPLPVEITDTPNCDIAGFIRESRASEPSGIVIHTEENANREGRDVIRFSSAQIHEQLLKNNLTIITASWINISTSLMSSTKSNGLAIVAQMVSVSAPVEVQGTISITSTTTITVNDRLKSSEGTVEMRAESFEIGGAVHGEHGIFLEWPRQVDR